MKIIYKRELLAYFRSLPAYFFIACLLLIMGIVFLSVNLVQGYPAFSASLGSILLIFVFTIPLITMTTFSEERKFKIDQMLLTAPVSIRDIVVGKYLATCSVFAVPMLVSTIFPLLIASIGNSYLVSDFSTILALFLMGALYVSIGLYISSLTESQMIAGVLTGGILLLLQLWPTLISYLPMSGQGSFLCFMVVLLICTALVWNTTKNNAAGLVVLAVGAVILCGIAIIDIRLLAGVFPRLMDALDMTSIFDHFAYYYQFDLEGIIRYLSISGLFLFLTIQSVEKRRWM